MRWYITLTSLMILVSVLSSALAQGTISVSPEPKILPISSQSHAIAWSSDGNRFATAGIGANEEEIINIWAISDLENNTEVEPVLSLSGHRQRVSLLRWSPDGHKLASLEWGQLYVWDLEEARLLYSIPIFASSMTWSPDGDSIATSTKSIEIWNAASGERTDEFVIPTSLQPQDTTWSISKIVWSPAGTFIASIKPTVLIWDVSSNMPPTEISCCASGSYEIEWNPSGDMIASHEGVYRVTTGETVISYDALIRVSWSPNGGSIAGVILNELRIIDGLTGDVVWATQADTSPLIAVEWSPDGSKIAALDFEGTVYLWDIIDLGQ